MPPPPGTRRRLRRNAAGSLACVATAVTSLACASATPAQPTGDVQSIVRAAQADAGRRSGIDPAQTKVLAVESVTWRDGSLGCPEPGALYTQALVPGWRIRIEAGGRTHEYHASLRGQWLWCPAERAQQPAPDPRI